MKKDTIARKMGSLRVVAVEHILIILTGRGLKTIGQIP